ncbi:MAG: galactose mutarotase [Melioribacteraceae bacterium]|nr:galactose mutarotase [Melioribacteraceae bacterium]
MIEKKTFGKISDGTETFLYTLKNKNGIIAEITNYGAAVVSLTAPDKNGELKDIVLGYDEAASYEKCQSYFGVIVGRYGNRIGEGKFTLDGKEYQVSVNDGKNSLHGGFKGFNKRVWKAEPIMGDSSQSLKLTYISEDGEEGYPGKVEISVTYTLNDKNELALYYSATTDKPTIMNPTHHSYFNLTGDFTKPILDHQLMIDAETYTPVDNGLITTGEFASVAGNPMDFRVLTNIGAKINDKFEQLVFGKGYDHNWVINNWDGSVKKVAELYEPASGRLMEVISDQPGLQFYSGNFLNGSAVGKGGVVYNYRTGLCLEAQHHPDSPNKPNFPSVRLNPGEQYKQVTIYKFSVK